VVLVAAMAAILVVTIAGTVLFFTQTYPPLSAAHDFTDEIRDGDFDDAFEQVCTPLRTPALRDDFDQLARRLSRADDVSIDIFSVDRDGDRATVDFDATYGDDTFEATLPLVREAGDWRPCP
jgi:hypothetical protein